MQRHTHHDARTTRPESMTPSMAPCSAAGLPEHSMARSAARFGAECGVCTVLAPNVNASPRRTGSGSRASILSPSLRSAATTNRPITPQPNTYTVSPIRGCASWTMEMAVSAAGRKVAFAASIPAGTNWDELASTIAIDACGAKAKAREPTELTETFEPTSTMVPTSEYPGAKRRQLSAKLHSSTGTMWLRKRTIFHRICQSRI